MIPSLEGLPTKAKEAPSPYEVRLSPLDTNPVFHSFGGELTLQALTLQTYGFAPLTRWCRDLQKGVLCSNIHDDVTDFEICKFHKNIKI